MPAKKVSAKKGLSQPPLYAILLVTIVIVVVVLIFTLVPMGKKASEQEQQIMAKLDKTEEAGDVLLIISSILLGITFLMMMKDFYMCGQTKTATSTTPAPPNPLTKVQGTVQPTIQMPTSGTVQQTVKTNNDGSSSKKTVVTNVKDNLPKLSAFGCTPLLTIFTAAATLLISVIALTTQLSGKKTTESIISKNEKTYVDNNNEENTQIMAKNEENLKSFKRNILWSIILMILSFLLAIITAYVLSSFSRYKLSSPGSKDTYVLHQKIGNFKDQVTKKGRDFYTSVKNKAKSLNPGICGIQCDKDDLQNMTTKPGQPVKQTGNAKKTLHQQRDAGGLLQQRNLDIPQGN